jgi:hypothetical protein
VFLLVSTLEPQAARRAIEVKNRTAIEVLTAGGTAANFSGIARGKAELFRK